MVQDSKEAEQECKRTAYNKCYPEISLNVGFGDECPSTTAARKWVKWQLISRQHNMNMGLAVCHKDRN